GEHDEGELVPGVGASAGVVPDQHRIVEVDGVLAGGSDVDDVGGSGFAQQREQQAGQVVAREVVDGESHFYPVGALLALTSGRSRADPGVVDQDVELFAALGDVVRQLANLVQIGQIGDHDVQVLVPGGGGQLVADGFGALRVAAVDEHVRPFLRELSDERPAEPVRRSGD